MKTISIKHTVGSLDSCLRALLTGGVTNVIDQYGDCRDLVSMIHRNARAGNEIESAGGYFVCDIHGVITALSPLGFRDESFQLFSK